MKQPIRADHYMIAAVSVTFFLFFIDEGYYDFRWMKSFGNWIVFVIYTVFLLGGQLLLGGIILSRYTGRGKSMIAMIAGVPLGFLLWILLLYARGFRFD